MSRAKDRPQPPSGNGVPANVEVDDQNRDVLADIAELAELLPRELWQEAADRWTELGLAWPNVLVARVLGVPEERVTRWQRRPELPPSVRLRLAAFCQLLALLESGKLVSLSQAEIGKVVAAVRGQAGEADRETVQGVLSLLESLFEEPALPPAI